MRILISNLNRLTTLSHVVTLLLPYGLVTSARIIVNVENGSSDGAALVEMESSAGQMAIYSLNNLQFMNYYIQVEESSSPGFRR